MITDRHRPDYFKDYHQKIKDDAIEAYGAKCSCINCINHRKLSKKERKILRIFVIDKKFEQGQYGVAAYLKRIKYKKDAAIILCRDCYLGKHMCDKKQYSDKHLSILKYFRKQHHYRRMK